MKVIIRTSGRKTIDYIVDCLSGNYGWDPIGTIEPQIVSRFIYQLVTLSKEADLYDNSSDPWEQVEITFGLAIYDHQTDTSVTDVARRADQMMYDNKRTKKNH